MLFEIEYQEYTIHWKFIGMLSKILVVICYGLLFISDKFYPITLVLEINNVKAFQLIVNCSIEGFKTLIFIFVGGQILMLGMAFQLVKYSGVTDSLIEVYFGINYEVTMIQGVNLVV